MGIDRSTPRLLIYGLEEFGGFGIRHLCTKMQGLKINSVISHLCAKTPLGLLIKINLEYLQLIVGIEFPILSSFEPSHHSEMYGVLSALVTIKHLISELNITIPPGKQFQLYCDNRSVVYKKLSMTTTMYSKPT
jgi:hypothetical protein